MKASGDKSTGLVVVHSGSLVASGSYVATKAGNGNKAVYMATPAAEKTFPDDVEKDWATFRKRLPLEMIKSFCDSIQLFQYFNHTLFANFHFNSLYEFHP